MSWAVTGDVGKRGSAINLNGFKPVHNIQTRKFFNTVQGIGPCFGEHGPAMKSNVFKKLHTIETRNMCDTVKWAQARPSHQFECFWKASHHPDEKCIQHREMSWTVFGEARPAVHLDIVDNLHLITTKRIFNAAKWAGTWQGMLGSAA